jgi:broad specificity phosphatase PhoE
VGTDGWVVILVRHGQAAKNLEDRHGGSGSRLTPLGLAQTTRVAERLRKYEPFDVVHTPRSHALESAVILATALGAPPPAPLDLEPFNLGVISGLSDEEVRAQFPDVAVQMAAYRGGRLEMCELEIPKGDSAASFYARTKVAADAIRSRAASTCVVGTRSVLVGLANTLVGRQPIPGGGYREIPWENAGYCVLRFDGTVIETEGTGVL